MEKMNFKKYKFGIDYVLSHFGLERGQSCAVLNAWLDVKIHDDYTLPALLEKKRILLAQESDLWNEEELKMHFLSFVVEFADFQIPKKAKLFYERPLAAIVQGTNVNVVCDALLASPLGISTPNKPYFFLQAFKKGKNAANDAEGQMLLAMLIAQALNDDTNPIYGCYLLGKDWRFASLHQKNYCISSSYDASKPQELTQIIHILGQLKTIIATQEKIDSFI
jgi:hypothetical protein